MATSKILNSLYSYFGFHSNFSDTDYLHAYGKESHALLYSVLFLPEFIEIESSVFLKRNVFDEELLKEKILNIEKEKSVSDIESSYNFIEVSYLFDSNGRDISENDEVLLASRIKNAWIGCLKICYPSRNFKVEVISPEETGSSVGVHFYETR